MTALQHNDTRACHAQRSQPELNAENRVNCPCEHQKRNTAKTTLDQVHSSIQTCQDNKQEVRNEHQSEPAKPMQRGLLVYETLHLGFSTLCV